MSIKKLFAVLLGVALGALTAFAGCEDKSDLNTTGEPESYYVYGLNEQCRDGDVYFKIVSVEFSIAEDISESGEYNLTVTLCVETNLSEEQLFNDTNRADLITSVPSALSVFNLNFTQSNYDEMKLIFGCGLQEDEMQSVKNLEAVESAGEAEYPELNVFIEYFNAYCVVDGENYVGRYFRMQLR